MFKEAIAKNTIGMKTKLPLGYKSAGIHCGIKKSRKDLAIIVSEYPATAAGVFTLNKVQAAPVLISKKHLNEYANFYAIIVNSGNANACTGDRGYIDAELMAEHAGPDATGEQVPEGRFCAVVHHPEALQGVPRALGSQGGILEDGAHG
ncbi:MAG: bifunctional ornithine acetyltransferase/N-acetylglutamate synthase, partial [Ignavibacteria bacterium]|nr:bifunctional ornithine acetyltransferase/N-acetylglutamate synthase [Ignavibacteria bacterium]